MNSHEKWSLTRIQQRAFDDSVRLSKALDAIDSAKAALRAVTEEILRNKGERVDKMRIAQLVDLALKPLQDAGEAYPHGDGAGFHSI